MMPGDNYRAASRVARSIGWPKRFRDDLTKHDRKFMCDLSGANPRAAFLWMLYEDGTHIADMSPGGKSHRELLAAALDTFPGVRVFVVRHGTCREIGRGQL